MPKRTVLIQKPSKLSVHNAHLRVVQEAKEVEIPLEDIWVIVLESHQITATTALLSGLADQGIGVLLCGKNHMPNGLALPLAAHSRHAWIVEQQLLLSKPLKKQLWKKLVIQKITNQAACLECLGLEGAAAIRALARTVTSGDTTNREAVAASQYFRQMIDVGTRREGPWAGPLDYGYAILRAGIARVAVSGGWLVSRGIHHCSDTNAFNLVDDLIEPFRPVVDLLVASKQMQSHFGPEERACLSRLFQQIVVLEEEKYTVQAAIDVVLDSFKKAVLSGDVDQLKLPELCGLEWVKEE